MLSFYEEVYDGGSGSRAQNISFEINNSNGTSIPTGKVEPVDRYSSKKTIPGSAGGVTGVGAGAGSGQEFILQLAATRRMLYSVLEKHDAVPDRVNTCSTICDCFHISYN